MLTLPHPRALERAFVLLPLAEIAPEGRILGVRIKDALAGSIRPASRNCRPGDGSRRAPVGSRRTHAPAAVE